MSSAHSLKPLRKQPARNRRARYLAVLATLFTAAALLAGCGRRSGQTVLAEGEGTSGQPVAEQPSAIRIPEGTTISVRLLSSISSSSARSGDEFDAELAVPLVIDGQTVFAKSARARVRVVSARASGRLKNPGFLKLTLDAIQDPAGNWEPVDTNSISASGGSHSDRNATLIGGGTAVGAIIGAIAGGGKGAAIGAASGAGAGTAGAMATGKKEVTFAAERLLRFRSLGEIALNR